MTKPTPQSDPQRKAPARDKASTSHDLQAAYQCHTLAQLLFSQLATAYPWLATPPPGPAGWPQAPLAQPPLGQPPQR